MNIYEEEGPNDIPVLLLKLVSEDSVYVLLDLFNTVYTYI